MTGYLPLADDVISLVRRLELSDSPGDAETWLLRQTRAAIAAEGHQLAPMRVVTDAAVVDVNFSAQYDKHTGIQRVTREVWPGGTPSTSSSSWPGHRVSVRCAA